MSRNLSYEPLKKSWNHNFYPLKDTEKIKNTNFIHMLTNIFHITRFFSCWQEAVQLQAHPADWDRFHKEPLGPTWRWDQALALPLHISSPNSAGGKQKSQRGGMAEKETLIRFGSRQGNNTPH